MRGLDPPGQAVLPNLDLADEVQPEVGKIREIVLGEGFPSQMGVDEAKTQKPAGSFAEALEGGDLHLVVVSHQHHKNGSPPVHQNPDLSAGLQRDL
jgi:hypothetical protein